MFGHLLEVVLKLIKEISAEIYEEGSGRDAFGREVMKMLYRLAYSKAVPYTQEIFASKGANQVICSLLLVRDVIFLLLQWYC